MTGWCRDVRGAIAPRRPPTVRTRHPASPGAAMPPGELLRLQRLAGNCAVAHAIAGDGDGGTLGRAAAIIQRVPVSAFAGPLGVTPSPQVPQKSPVLHGAAPTFTRRPVGGARVADSYRLPPLGAAATRSEAMILAAERIATFSQALLQAWESYRFSKAKNKRTHQAATELRIGKKANADDTQTIDPFILRVDLQVDTKSGPTTLRLYYQFDNSYYGYVVGITERRGDQLTKGVMSEAQSPQGAYSNVHETAEESITSQVDQPGAPLPYDAMTKLAGEGARWQCVRRAAQQGKLSDGVVFYAQLEGGHVGIRFSDLWKRWRDFGNRFDIPDTDVVEKLREWHAGGAVALVRDGLPAAEHVALTAG